MDALGGIRILDFSGLMTGPYATQLLADMGADVVKVERPGTGDYTRDSGPTFLGGESVVFLSYNRNKKSIAVDLKHPESKEIIHRLVKQSDVLVENFRPGAMDRLGLGYEALSKINPQIVYCSISGYGQTGPYRDKPGQDLILQGMGGLISLTGEEGGQPTPAGTYIADITGALLATVGILAALIARQRLGTGQHVEVSMLDGLVWIQPREIADYLASGELPQKGGRGHYRMAPYGVFAGSDGKHFTVVAHKDTFPRLCSIIGASELANDPRFSSQVERVRNRKVLMDKLQEIFLRDTASNWLKLLDANGIWCGPVYNHEELLNDPAITHSGIIQAFSHPTAGKVRVPGIPIKLNKTPGRIRFGAPLLGQHTEEILLSIGFEEQEIEQLETKGVIERYHPDK